MIIDLRTEAERSRNPRTSDIVINTPLPPLNQSQIADLKVALTEVARDIPDRPIKVFCAKGSRSRLATSILRDMGVEVVDLGGVR